MNNPQQNQSLLLFAFGNISRGDDALGPLLLQRMQQQNINQAGGYPLNYLQDYQIQVEHVMDMQDCERVILIDASQSLQQAYDFYCIQEQPESSYTTHGMSASNLLHIYRQVYHQPAPPTYMLAIEGNSFELGHPLSSKAEINLQSAYGFLTDLLSAEKLPQWGLHNNSV